MAQKADTKEAKTEKTSPHAQTGTAGVVAGMSMTEAVKGGALSTEMQQMYSDMEGAGFEETDAKSYAIPFLIILQSGSPQVKREEVDQYVEGAEAGMLFNTVTGKLYDVRANVKPKEGAPEPGVHVVCAHYNMRYIEWAQRERGGGFIKEHPPTTPLATQTTKDEKNRDKLPNGNNLVDTRNHYSILLDEDGPVECVISMSSTQVKKSRNWISRMGGQKIAIGSKLVKCPMFAYIWKLTTVPEKNDQGSWYGWKIEPYGPVTDMNLLNEAKKFHELVKSGQAVAAQPTEQVVNGDDTGAHDEELEGQS